MFCYDELSNIALVHLEFFPDHLRVFVPKIKNDIFREGNYVYIKFKFKFKFILFTLIQLRYNKNEG